MRRLLTIGLGLTSVMALTSCENAINNTDTSFACEYVKIKNTFLTDTYNTTTTRINEIVDNGYYTYYSVDVELSSTAKVNDICFIYVDIYPYLNTKANTITMKADIYYDTNPDYDKPVKDNYKELVRFYNKNLFEKENTVINYDGSVSEYKKRG